MLITIAILSADVLVLITNLFFWSLPNLVIVCSWYNHNRHCNYQHFGVIAISTEVMLLSLSAFCPCSASWLFAKCWYKTLKLLDHPNHLNMINWIMIVFNMKMSCCNLIMIITVCFCQHRFLMQGKWKWQWWGEIWAQDWDCYHYPCHKIMTMFCSEIWCLSAVCFPDELRQACNSGLRLRLISWWSCTRTKITLCFPNKTKNCKNSHKILQCEFE